MEYKEKNWLSVLIWNSTRVLIAELAAAISSVDVSYQFHEVIELKKQPRSIPLLL